MARFRRGKFRKRFLVSMTLLVIGIALVGATSGAVDIFLKIDGGNLAGESQDANHEGWINVDGFNFGVSTPSSNLLDKSRSGIADFSPVTISKGMDRSTPGLFLSAANGAVYPSATLDVCISGATDIANPCFFQVGLKNVSVGSMETSASSGADRPQDNLTLNFTEIQWTYITPSTRGSKTGAGTMSMGWNALENTPTGASK